MVVVLPTAAVVSPVPGRSAGASSSSHDGRLLDGLLRRCLPAVIYGVVASL